MNRPALPRIHCLASVLLLAGALLAGCERAVELPEPGLAASVPVQFDDVTAASGVDFRHNSGAAGRKLLPETMGAGCAVFDVDNDGRLDLLFVDSTSWPGSGGPRGRSRLYRNLGGWRFQDVTEQYGLPSGLYGMGAAAGDYDNDGYTDVLITALNDSRLLRNRGGRGFEDVTRRVGLKTPGWPTSAAWLDFNRDGNLDLFVCHYVQWTPETDVPFSLDGVHKTYSRPDQYLGEPCQLLVNRGGRFEDVSAAVGVRKPNTKALGVALCDLEADGWIDVAVSNDTVPNFLFHNQGNFDARGRGTFKEVAVQAGMAVAEGGSAKAGMGIDAADYDNSGSPSILITNFAGEQLSLYRREPSGLFMDVAARAGIGTPSQQYLGFGALFLDADLDGWLDILVANGHIQEDVGKRSSGVSYREPALLFIGQADGRFREPGGTGALSVPRVARGAASGDLDGDGDLDLVLTTNGGPPALLRQAGRPANGWLRLRLEGRSSNRSAIGATVRVRSGGGTQTRMVRSGSSYLSQSSLPVTFGLGRATAADEVEVRWPNGSVESFGARQAGREWKLVEGAASRAGGPSGAKDDANPGS